MPGFFASEAAHAAPRVLGGTRPSAGPFSNGPLVGRLGGDVAEPPGEDPAEDGR